LFNGVNRPDLVAKFTFIKLILLAILIYPATINLGISGTALAVVVSALAIEPFRQLKVTQLIKIDKTKFFKYFIFPLLGTGFMTLTIFCAKLFLLTQVTLLNFGLLAITGVCTYLIAILAFEKVFGYKIRENVKILLNHIKNKAP
ncbi:MAG: hypothetical protein ACTSPL_08215, partial [Candidatus Odinarchaeia archaeon]